MTIILLSCGLFASGCLSGEKQQVPDNHIISGATFYIDDFDMEKASDEEVVATLAKIIRNFDVIGLQGIKDENGEAMQILIDEINNGFDENGDPYNYQFNLSEIVGRTTCCEEQYAYIYNRTVLYPSSVPRTYADDDDVFNRDPYLVAFRAYEGQGQVLFVLLTTDKNNVKEEIDALPALIEKIKTEYAGHDTITVVGNLYSDAPYYDEKSDSPLRSSEYVWIITDDMVTSTEGDYTYDRIIATANLKNYYGGNAGVFNFSEEYGLNKTETEKISTHYPVFVQYYMYPPGQ
ncbi:hypothetical protein [Methanimicrococcus stummii]|uniref:hypothetical protein n=1 Tax=Methanimicrococcus stummii TaxID=3028294 RepID=UPI002931A6AE|nr:hypothetical protein [Methanimicrococcus sp. Es2]